MQEGKQKEKSKKFRLPSSLRTIQQQHKHEINSFAKNLGKNQQASKLSKAPSKHHSLFKLNPSSSALMTEVPVETLRQRSKSQKLQTLQGQLQKQSFNLLDHYKEIQETHMKEKKPILKLYNIDIRQMVAGENKYEAVNNQQEQQQPEKYEIVKPSLAYHPDTSKKSTIFEPTMFQTPILPCFSSQFQKRGLQQGNKSIQQGEGVWRIGKLKIKGKKVTLNVGQFQFQGQSIRSEGRAGLLSEGSIHFLPNWKDICILQPTSKLFTAD